ncbi:hypothetical protein [Sphingomicrobium sediminis]|nr:hypothetical protein [Sphingomicrobium sediminis]
MTKTKTCTRYGLLCSASLAALVFATPSKAQQIVQQSVPVYSPRA